jgi:hypothetical protein
MGQSVKSKLSLQIFYRFAVTSLQIVTISSFLFRAAAQTPAPIPTSAAASSPVPVITFDQESFDFGKIELGKTIVHRFKVSNTGNATLHIKKVQASCGCTSTLVGKMDLAPGENTEIEAAFTPESASGPVRKSIRVISDDPAHSKLTLHFRADVFLSPMSGQPALLFHDVDRTSHVRIHGSVRLAVPAVSEIRLGDATFLSVYPKSDHGDTTLDIVLDGSELPKEGTSGQNTITVISADHATIPVTVGWEAEP